MDTIFVGIDVSKNKFDVCKYGDSKIHTFDNTKNGFKKLFKEFKSDLNNMHVVVEATGGYESKLLSALCCKKINAYKADSKIVYNYLRSLNKYGKTDSIDAKGLARYIKERLDTLKPYEEPAKDVKQLTDNTNRINQLKEMLTQEKNRLQSPDNESMKNKITKHINFLEKQIEELVNDNKKIIDGDEELSSKNKCLQEIKGVGETVSHTLLAFLTELGKVNRGQIASLCGLAPHPKDSGSINSYRSTIGGRKEVRNMLFMAALSCIRHNIELKEIYNGLISRGKKKMVAIIAVARRLIVMANSKIKKLSIG